MLSAWKVVLRKTSVAYRDREREHIGELNEAWCGGGMNTLSRSNRSFRGNELFQVRRSFSISTISFCIFYVSPLIASIPYILVTFVDTWKRRTSASNVDTLCAGWAAYTRGWLNGVWGSKYGSHFPTSRTYPKIIEVPLLLLVRACKADQYIETVPRPSQVLPSTASFASPARYHGWAVVGHWGLNFPLPDDPIQP